jgi:hypothetical protein
LKQKIQKRIQVGIFCIRFCKNIITFNQEIMKKLVIFAFLSFFLSCSKSDDCGCESIVGNKYAWSVKRQNVSESITLDDFKFRKDGKIDIWILTPSDYKFIENVGTYEIRKENGNCQLKTNMIPSYKPFKKDPQSLTVLFGISTDGQWTPFIVENCDAFNFGSLLATRQ